MERPNIVVVLSDEHTGSAAGWAGHPRVLTPNLDRLAGTGTAYEHAYTNSPMCVPSRLSLLTGQYVHQIGAWDNGVVPGPEFRSWGHHLREAGYRSVIAGRTHFNGPDRTLGFDARLTDDLEFWIDHSGRPPRRTQEWRRQSNSHVSEHGTGDHVHTQHDVATTDAALEFLRDPGSEPYLLYVGYMHPHFPLVAPPEFRALYDPATVELPPTWQEELTAQHPVIQTLRRGFRNDEPITEDEAREATACYWALISHLDHQVGRLLAEIPDDTVVLYTSDHGELAGHHGIWQKQCFYEPAVHIPLLLRHPGGRPGRVADAVSLVDVLPTLRDLAGLPVDPALPGHTLLDPRDRPVLSEYHAQGMVDGGFMLRSGPWKYCYYGAGVQPQVFNLDDDPYELNDLSGDEELVRDLDARLRSILDPDVTDQEAKADQRRRAS
ncbi:sulfatase-like hydrolase/transferase [Kribbella amoyensis]|uniref:sulfatase-like hydrolase/transferase n=1 Tax=Kribbella amoyensis TaxID=996641 RepID=UPI00147980BF|nr:sulfatase-like hydrolase/transferase [Kribbella amoyensis]